MGRGILLLGSGRFLDQPRAVLPAVRATAPPVAPLLDALRIEGAPGEPARVGLLASSFDPMTVAHAAIAEAARYTNDLVLLLFASSASLPKEGDAGAPLLSESDRMDAVRAWCATHPGALPALCPLGLLVEQARAARSRFPDAQLHLYCGSDKLLQLLDPKWYEDRDAALDELFGLATVTYAVRTGDRSAVAAALADPANRRWRARCRKLPIDPALASVSSRAVRARIRSGQEWRSLVPVEVASALDA